MMAADEDDYDFDDLAEFDEPEPDDDLSDLDPLDEPDADEGQTDAHGTRPVEKAQAKTEPPTLGRDRERSRPGLIATPATKTSEAIRRPLMSGHCAFPQSHNPDESHARCRGYSRANPDKIFQPCPCPHHYPEERYECAGCGGTILAAPHYPLDEDGDIRYVHLDTKRNRATDEECPR